MGIKPKGATIYCSFCGKSQHEVIKLIAAQSANICNECIERCTILTNENFNKDTRLDRATKLVIRLESLETRFSEILAECRAADLDSLREAAEHRLYNLIQSCKSTKAAVRTARKQRKRGGESRVTNFPDKLPSRP